jgi:hypothetical protein
LWVEPLQSEERCDTPDVTTHEPVRKHYANSLVTEALIDIRIESLPDSSLKLFAKVPRELKRDYPVARSDETGTR